jgi:NAD-dependent SIR2 family protein deacetylase
MSYATIYGYDRAPHLIWELMRDFLAETTPRPNPGHVALAELQSLGIVRALVTQNVGARALRRCVRVGPLP